MWKLLSTAYPTEFRGIAPHYRMKIESPKLTMKQYLDLVRSDNEPRWDVVLTVCGAYAQVPEMVEMARVKNLAALEIDSLERDHELGPDPETPVARLNDRIVRTWSELVRGSGAFARLRVLRLQHQRELTGAALRYLRGFPALQTVVLYDCPGVVDLLGGRGGDRGLVVVDGWVVSGLEWTKDWPPELWKTYVESFVEDEGIIAGLQSLDFQVGQRQEKPRRMRTREVVCLQRATDTEAAETVNPPKRSPEMPASGSKKRRRGVMKERKGPDLGGMLADLGW